jgi:hypothetical protein
VSRFNVLRSRTRFRRYRGCRVPFSCFALVNSFSVVPTASSPVFMFSAPGLVFGCTDVVRSRFHVLRSRTRFQRYRGRRVPFSCFELPDLFSAVPRTSGYFFMFCAPGLLFGVTDGVESLFHVLCSRTHFRRYRGRRILFLCFDLSESISAVQRASGPVFMFCAPGHIFDRTEGVRSRLYVLRSRTLFQRDRGRRVPFSCIALPDSFSEMPSASGPVFMFYAPRLVFGGTDGVGSRFNFLRSRFVFGGIEGVGSRFHVLRSRTRFRRCRVRRVPFTCFACPDSFSAVPRASGPVFMFCASGLVFGVAECVGSRV